MAVVLSQEEIDEILSWSDKVDENCLNERVQQLLSGEFIRLYGVNVSPSVQLRYEVESGSLTLVQFSPAYDPETKGFDIKHNLLFVEKYYPQQDNENHDKLKELIRYLELELSKAFGELESKKKCLQTF